MHIINQKMSFDIFTEGNLQYFLIEDDLYLLYMFFFFNSLIYNDIWDQIKMYNFDSYNAVLAFPTNIQPCNIGHKVLLSRFTHTSTCIVKCSLHACFICDF